MINKKNALRLENQRAATTWCIEPMNNRQKQLQDRRGKSSIQQNYSLCRASCSVCPYQNGLLKLLDHGITIVPTLPESDH